MVNLLKKELGESKTTTIVVSHNRSFLEAADVVIIINSGRIVYNGNLEGAMPLLEDLSVCTYRNTCEGEHDAECYR
jgi:Fe-S cluster assembly ATP-binding protein